MFEVYFTANFLALSRPPSVYLNNDYVNLLIYAFYIWYIFLPQPFTVMYIGNGLVTKNLTSITRWLLITCHSHYLCYMIEESSNTKSTRVISKYYCLKYSLPKITTNGGKCFCVSPSFRSLRREKERSSSSSKYFI